MKSLPMETQHEYQTRAVQEMEKVIGVRRQQVELPPARPNCNEACTRSSFELWMGEWMLYTGVES